MFKKILFLIAALQLTTYGTAQTKIYGQIQDTDGYAVEFVSVYFADKSGFTTSDAEGNYEISCKTCTSDTLVFRSLGYKIVKKTYRKGTDQLINVLLTEDVIQLQAVVIEQVENPAFKVMRRVIENKPQNDIRALDAYQYESYNRVELDVNNISEEFMQKKLLSKLNTSLEELEKLTDSKGRQFFPVFISESLSDYYYRANPTATKENIKATRVKGIGTTDGSFTSQLVGASFTQFNFYENNLTVLEKEIISPIANGWRLYYDYELVDSVLINNELCYELDVKPKNANSVAFVGKIWVNQSDYALTKIDLTIPSTANLNFIKSIEVKREWKKTSAGPYFPRRTDLIIDADNVNEKWASMMVKSTFTVDSLVVNQPKPIEFYRYALEVDEQASEHTSAYWQEHRHDTLSSYENDAFALVDTINNLPIIRSYIDVFNIVVNGYKDIGKVAIGPYISTYARNNVEYNRFKLGFKTNTKFSKNAFFDGYLAYGTQDQVLKHNLEGRFILERRPYTKVGFQWRKDLDQLGISELTDNSVFDAFIRWGNLIGAYYHSQQSAYVYRQLSRHFSSQISLNNRKIDPVFNFGYFKEGETSPSSVIHAAEAEIKLRFAHNERFLDTDYGRVSLGSQKPVFEATYSYGLKGVLKSDFEYHRIILGMNHQFGLGLLGKSTVIAQAGKVFGDVPYPLLNVHLGNQTPFYAARSFNMMRYFEFVSQQFIETRYIHHFDGFFFDRIPIMSRLKWRTVANFSALWGNVSQANIDILEPNSRLFGRFGNVPYMEVGYGIENIFKLLRLEVFQRLTYLDNPGARRFGLKGTLQFTL